jgi:hypothetical protein
VLGRAIDGGAGHGESTSQRSHVHHVSAARGEHQGQEGLRAIEDAEIVGSNDPLDLLHGELRERPPSRDPRVVHQHVAAAESLLCSKLELIDLSEVRHVALNRHRPASSLVDQRGGLLQQVLPSRGEYHVRALGSEGQRRGPADT